MSNCAVFNPTCSGCGRRMGDMTEDEFVHLVRTDGLGAKCFDCDDGGACAVPDFFEDMKKGEMLRLGEKWFMAYGRGIEALSRVLLALERMRVGARSCLSSSTYLNTFPKRDGWSSPAIETNAKCPNCGVERMFEAETFRECPNCDYQELKPLEITLPVWVVNQPERAKSCPDCNDVRRASMFSGPGAEKLYCDYHLAFLVEQSEDRDLGRGHA